ncbi:RNA-directed DNA polymerase [Haloferula sp. A504]|uniref:RNA-directed DNA polymerase n=1 Tax=Haloferula sp. A504 TaxID=3373601 RepID=UPI0031C8A171|nr:RNA-directed DNA polymerase [Verrucomicrobiaceae bacterium E54]
MKKATTKKATTKKATAKKATAKKATAKKATAKKATAKKATAKKTPPKKVTPRSVLKMTAAEARSFFLKGESYCNLDLPPYFDFEPILRNVDAILSGRLLSSMWSNSPCEVDAISHTILNNKDGRYAWRPIQLTHPALYVSLVHHLTDPANWTKILDAFKRSRRDPQIHCLSLPVESRNAQQDKAAQVLQWWEDVEQRSIQLSIEYEYLFHADITDCYGSIYTHSLSWALHGRAVMKQPVNRNNRVLIGNIIDRHLMDMSHGQTNGIPQGSVLMDFIAELVLGYADRLLRIKIRRAGIRDYQILRYRDDYRIFTNHPTEGEEILRLLTETMHFLGMKLSPAKTGPSSSVVAGSVKPDKIDWITQMEFNRNLQKHLLLIHGFSRKHPNSGSLIRALVKFYRRIHRRKKAIADPKPMIALTVDIAANNPRAYSITAAIISKLLSNIGKGVEVNDLLGKIRNRFERVPNTGHLQIWLQRISHFHQGAAIGYTEPICKLLGGGNPTIWKNDWIQSRRLKAAIDPKRIVDKKVVRKTHLVIALDEVQLFNPYAT